MSDFDQRQEIVANLRAMAALLEQNENLPVPYSVYLGVYPENIEEARTARKGIFGWSKNTSPASPSVDYSLSIGENEWGQGSVTYSMSVMKTQTCKRVQVGVKHIEAHDEPVYEWDCGTGSDEQTEA